MLFMTCLTISTRFLVPRKSKEKTKENKKKKKKKKVRILNILLTIKERSLEILIMDMLKRD
jgi:hypothetical protein